MMTKTEIALIPEGADWPTVCAYIVEAFGRARPVLPGTRRDGRTVRTPVQVSLTRSEFFAVAPDRWQPVLYEWCPGLSLHFTAESDKEAVEAEGLAQQQARREARARALELAQKTQCVVDVPDGCTWPRLRRLIVAAYRRSFDPSAVWIRVGLSISEPEWDNILRPAGGSVLESDLFDSCPGLMVVFTSESDRLEQVRLQAERQTRQEALAQKLQTRHQARRTSYIEF